MESLQTPLNNAQLELLKIFSKGTTEDELLKLKDLLTNFYAQRAMDKADQIWDERGYTQENMDQIAKKAS